PSSLHMPIFRRDISNLTKFIHLGTEKPYYRRIEYKNKRSLLACATSTIGH
ncbi:hypothetical protein ACJX0J_023424, partial [Zea mays]